MNEDQNIIDVVGMVNVGLSFAQTEEILRYIQLGVSILASIILVILRIAAWHRKAKKDGKIDENEIHEAIGIIEEGVKEVKEAIPEPAPEPEPNTIAARLKGRK